jgi:uncharacterized protein (DUF362 family)/Pyruvate/2-oxoacid:ferredoxin oxidoreductase delta subunit
MPVARVTIYEAQYAGVADAVERAFDAFPLQVAGKTVLVKPNILGAVEAERHVCTHPSVVRAAVEALEHRGAGRVLVGDNSGMRAYGSNEHAARVAGILEAAGERYVNLGASPVATAVKSAFAETLAFSREVLESDLVINLPKMKTHVATGITGAVKNTFGHLVGGEKTRLHLKARGPENFARAVVDVFAVRPPDLSILDAVVAMEGQGPSGGRRRDVGRILASDSAVALDAVMAAMMGLEPASIPMLRIAAERGLGPMDLDGIQIEGPFEVVPRFKVPPIGICLGAAVSRLVAMILVTQPKVRMKKCVKCGSCAEACPVEAIAMTDGGPVIDYAKCIACFCCHEMCRYEAMTLGRRMRFLQARLP